MVGHSTCMAHAGMRLYGLHATLLLHHDFLLAVSEHLGLTVLLLMRVHLILVDWHRSRL